MPPLLYTLAFYGFLFKRMVWTDIHDYSKSVMLPWILVISMSSKIQPTPSYSSCHSSRLSRSTTASGVATRLAAKGNSTFFYHFSMLMLQEYIDLDEADRMFAEAEESGDEEELNELKTVLYDKRKKGFYVR